MVTEAFFEKPHQLRKSKPDLYSLLRNFYGVDPAAGMVSFAPESRSDDA